MKELFSRSPSIEVEEIENSWQITINKKSRFLQKDVRTLMDKLSDYDFTQITVKITGPLCSKARNLLTESGFHISD